MARTNSPFSYLQKALDEYPHLICLKIGGIELSYSDFSHSLGPIVSFFINKKVSKNSKVALYTDDDLLMLQSVFALWEIGATAIPMNIKFKEDKLRIIEHNIQPDLGFYSPNFQIGKVETFPLYELVYNKENKCERNPVAADENNLALIMFTSGSTGIPKGVPLTHKAVYLNTSSTAAFLELMQSDRLLVNTPPYTTSSMIHALTMFSVGASIVIERGFMFGSNLLTQIVEHNCTGFGGVPVHFSRILGGLSKMNSVGKLRFLMNSGEHLPVPIINKLRQKIAGVKIFCVYGLTEVAGRLCILDNKYIDTKQGSVGKPLPGMRVCVRDEQGEVVAPGIEGQVYVEGSMLTKGYLNNDAINKAEFTKWGFATGDYGYIDEDGFLFIKGRKDDIIKVGGEKVSIKMIEEAVYDYDDFLEFMVTAVSDENMGCVLSLQYVLKTGVIFVRSKFIKYISDKLPSTHVPVIFEQVQSIERTSSGKTIRKKTI